MFLVAQINRYTLFDYISRFCQTLIIRLDFQKTRPFAADLSHRGENDAFPDLKTPASDCRN